MHHIISDGWSSGVLVRELTALYEAHLQGKPSVAARAAGAVRGLRRLAAAVAEARCSSSSSTTGEAARRAPLRRWSCPRTGPPRPSSPSAAPRSGRPLHAAVRVAQRPASARASRPSWPLLAAFQLLLSRYSGQQDICVGSPIAGRHHAELEGLIGFFVNTLVLRARIAPGTPSASCSPRCAPPPWMPSSTRTLPFEKLVEALQPQRDLSRSPLFQVMFVLQNAPMAALALPGLSLRPLESSRTPNSTLTLFLSESPEGFHGRWSTTPTSSSVTPPLAW